MKKILSVAILALIIPQIAFAAWWNPLDWFNGWSFLHRTDTNTQALENRVAELESKLANVATSTVVATTSPSAQNLPSKPTSLLPANTKPSQNDNYSSAYTSAISDHAALYANLIKQDDLAIKYLNLDLNSITATRDQTVAYGEGLGSSGKVTDVINVLVNAYNEDIRQIGSYVNGFINLRSILNDNYNHYNNLATQSVGTFVSYQDFKTMFVQMQDEPTFTKLNNQLNANFEGYKTYRKNTDNAYASAFAYLKGVLNSYQSSTSNSNYQTLPALPTSASTYCDTYSGDISCDTYYH
jgi:hypothetical protein